MRDIPFIILYSNDKWSVGYWPYLDGFEHIQIRNADVAYSGLIVQGSRCIPKEVQEAYYFWCAMLEA